ncbi:hypothetical protein [Acidiferrobacter sp.]|uniref:hypothetical protein n=1 Tax=Acidiferrobacter sp. TaxID=1872107 RepID=UPI00262B1384|nr:hypothetical protein [Acidiferrobacter sp.]
MTFDPRTRAPIRILPKMIDAACYNRVSLALTRLGEPLDVEIAPLRMIVCVKRRLWVARSLVNDIPLMAWVSFRIGTRGLHEPVPCQVHLYHFHAGLLMGEAPQRLANKLDERLDRCGDHLRGRSPAVTPLTRRDRGM